jgi:hypothetical protein
MLKPVLLCVLLAVAGALRATEEGSGDGDGGISRQFSDTEDLEDDVLPEDEDEGSGDDDADWVPPVKTTTRGKGKEKKIAPAMSSLLPQAVEEYEIHLDRDEEEAPSSSSSSVSEKTTATSGKKTDDMYEYYDELYPDEYKDIMKNYAPDDGGDKEEEDYQYTDTNSDFDRDSVLKIDEKKTTEDENTNDIEIKPRPGTSGTEEASLETSQIFIMVGSACVSFAIVMLTFFLCRRAMAKKRAKKSQLAAFAYNVPGDGGRKEANIVKDYQKVPTSTRELLQFQSTRIDMYGGEKGAAAAAASAPLVQ